MTDGRAIRAAGAEDASWIASYLREQWHATVMVVHGERIDLTLLPALIAGDRRGLLTWRRLRDDAELASINATPPWEGTGTALVEALVALLRAEGCARLWLTTTNDNLRALRFYMRRGFRLAQVRFGGVDQTRRLKPSIPVAGQDGIPRHEEIDLVRLIDVGATSGVPRPPWG